MNRVISSIVSVISLIVTILTIYIVRRRQTASGAATTIALEAKKTSEECALYKVECDENLRVATEKSTVCEKELVAAKLNAEEALKQQKQTEASRASDKTACANAAKQASDAAKVALNKQVAATAAATAKNVAQQKVLDSELILKKALQTELAATKAALEALKSDRLTIENTPPSDSLFGVITSVDTGDIDILVNEKPFITNLRLIKGVPFILSKVLPPVSQFESIGIKTTSTRITFKDNKLSVYGKNILPVNDDKLHIVNNANPNATFVSYYPGTKYIKGPKSDIDKAQLTNVYNGRLLLLNHTFTFFPFRTLLKLSAVSSATTTFTVRFNASTPLVREIKLVGGQAQDVVFTVPQPLTSLKSLDFITSNSSVTISNVYFDSKPMLPFPLGKMLIYQGGKVAPVITPNSTNTGTATIVKGNETNVNFVRQGKLVWGGRVYRIFL